MPTYREELQSMIKALDELYDRAGSLRDSSGNGPFEGKDQMNEIRKQLPKLWGILRKLDNNLPTSLANSQV